MKRLIYALLAIMVLFSSTGLAKQHKFSITTNPFGEQTISMQRTQGQNGTLEYRVADKSNDYNINYSPLPSALLLEPEEQYDVFYSTRIHPYPTQQGQEDTARILTSRSNPLNKWYIGDLHVPIKVVDQNQAEVYKLNGFAQFCPSLKYYFPDLLGGTFVIDSLWFLFYSYPDSPVNNSFYLGIIEVPGTNMGTDAFQGISINLDNALDSLEDVYEMKRDSINAHSTPTGNGSFNIRPWIVTFETASMRKMATIDNSNNAFCFIIFKNDRANLTDTAGLIGAWEWTVPRANHTFGSVVTHYPNNSDTVSTLFTTLAAYTPNVPSDYPQMAAEKFFRHDFAITIRGTYDGPVNVIEESKEANNYSLEQNYPNPVQDKSTIRFSIKQTNQVNIRVYNTVGQLVSELVDDVLNQGTYTTSFDASNLPVGAYIYTLQTGTTTLSKVLTVVR